jgi:hypothetical protein
MRYPCTKKSLTNGEKEKNKWDKTPLPKRENSENNLEKM